MALTLKETVAAVWKKFMGVIGYTDISSIGDGTVKGAISELNGKSVFGAWSGGYVGTTVGWIDIATFSLPAGRYEILSSAFQQPATTTGSPIVGLRLLVGSTAYAQMVTLIVSGQGNTLIHRAFIDLSGTTTIKLQFFNNSGVNINVSNRHVKATKISAYSLSS